MRSSIMAGLMASGAVALTDSSPFLMYSTSKLSLPSSNAQLQSSSAVLQTTHELLASCPTSLYLIYTQPNAHASDLRDPQTGKCLAPSLCAHLPSAPQIKTSFGVAEVIGAEISAADLQAYIETACAAQAGRESPSIAVTQLDALPPSSHRLGAGTGTGAGETRAVAMRTADWQLGQALNVTAESRGADYTVIYFASPHEPPRNYESEFVESPMEPMELRRRSDVMVERAAGEKTNSTQPLFVKYQFFTPGIFMGFLGTIIMLAMLYVGLSAVASLQVSYGAFEKEMGPAAQRKNM